MDIDVLREFVVLCECRNFHTAAARLHISQPALSRHLVDFEKEMGTTLLLRDTKHVELCDAGRLLLDDVHAILRQYDSLHEKIATNGLAGTLRVGGFTRHAKVLSVLCSAISRFEADYPRLQVAVTDIGGGDFKCHLSGDTLDMVFSPYYEHSDDDQFEYHDLFDLPLVVWLSKMNSLAARASVSLSDLQKQTLRFYSWGEWSDWRRFVERLFERSELVPRIGAPLEHHLLSSYSDTDYAFALDIRTSEVHRDDLACLDLEEGHKATLGMIFKPQTMNPAVRLFAAQVHATLNTP